MARTVKKTKKTEKPRVEKVLLKKVLRIVGAAVLLCAVITAIVYFVPKENGSFSFEASKGYFTARSFLNAVIKEDYEKAFGKLCVYDDAKDVSKGSSLSDEAAFKLWSERIKLEKGDAYSTYIVGFDDLKVYKEDGALKGTVVLEIRERGVSRYIAEEIGFYDGKIYTITKYSPELMNQLELAVSGYMGNNDE